MTEMSGGDLLAALDTVVKTLAERVKTLRATVEATMGSTRAERIGAYAGDEKLAAIERYPGNLTARVVDERAAVKWCGELYPHNLDEIVVIQPAFLTSILEHSAKTRRPGEHGVDPKTGQVLDWIVIERGSPYVKVAPTEDGRAVAQQIAGQIIDLVIGMAAAPPKAVLGDRTPEEIAEEKRRDDV